jgi:hypothetical protein
MTSPTVDPIVAPPAEKPAPLWEDFIDIFYAPSSVFRRRENLSPWPAILIISALLLIVSFATYNAMSGAIETEVRRQLAKNPQMTQDMIDKAMKFTSWTTRLGGIFYPIVIAVAAFLTWLIGKIVGAKQSYQVAMVMVAYASIVDVVKAIVTGAQALLMDSASLTSIYNLSLGPARFVDPVTVSPVTLAIYNRLDLFNIWYAVLLGIGMHVTGKVSKQNATIFAVLYWLLITGFALFGGRPGLQIVVKRRGPRRFRL